MKLVLNIMFANNANNTFSDNLSTIAAAEE